jgi:hypothetical protein
MTHRILLGLHNSVLRQLNCRTRNLFGSSMPLYGSAFWNPARKTESKKRDIPYSGTAEELRSWSRVLLCVLLFFLSSCASTKQPPAYPADSFTIDGVMHRSNVEGGCWVFRTNDGQSYELTGEAAKDLLREGLRAEIVVKPRRDVMSICMVGKIVEVVDIKAIHSESPR